MINRRLSFLAGTLLFTGQLLRHVLSSVLVYFLLCVPFAGTVLPAQAEQQAADLVTDNQPIDITDAQYLDLFRELQEQYHFPKAQLQQLFATLRIDRKVLQLMDRQGEAKPYYQYRSLFISPMTIAIGKQNLAIHQRLFDRIEEQYQVDREAIVAIWSIESRFGTSQGNFSLFQTLNTLFAAYPRRSAFYRNELINFLTLCRDNSFDPWSIKGSYAGAFGQAQFMPSSFNAYAVDFDGDRRADIVNSLPDTFASIAHYLKNFGWILHTPIYAELGRELRSDILLQTYSEGRKGRVDWRRLAKIQDVPLPQSPRDMPLSIIGLERAPQDGGGTRFIAGYPNMQAINEYNHSSKYAMAVAEMAEALKD
jgi:membrane-bound lytic murein transglycosylase B